MASDQDSVKSAKSTAAASLDSTAPPHETTPLLRPGKDQITPPEYDGTVVLRVLFTAFIVSLSFAVTQVPLVYVLGSMTCDEYYKTHPDPGAVADRCRHPEIEAGAARAMALLGASTTMFGVLNLFLTGWWIKRFGVKSALLVSIFWPATRLLIQNIGVETGAGLGVTITQLSQVMTIAGGPAGYQLSLNSFAAEVVKPAQRTATLGRLSGCTMFGTSLGFLIGGLLADRFGIKIPFRVTFFLFLISSLYAWLLLPWVPGHPSRGNDTKTRSISAFFEPLRMFVPQRWVLQDGKVRREYGVLLLGLGAFLGVLATGYIPTLLQLYSIDVLNFGTTENGWLIAINCMIRGLFMTLVFPIIISRGRKWLDRRNKTRDTIGREESGIPDLPTDPQEFVPDAIENGQEPVEPPRPDADQEESFQFDLIFTRWSIVVDGVLTGVATFVTQGWQIYLVAVVLPLAAGTGSAAKGVILQMCSPSERSDALSALSLVEMVAKTATIGVFGILFALFAEIGKPYLTFTCNAAVALLAFCVLSFSHFPPPGSQRLKENEDDGES